MIILKTITTTLIVLMMLVILFFMRGLKGKSQKASKVGFSIMELIYGMAIWCMWI